MSAPAKSKKPAAKPSHPPYKNMCLAAMKKLRTETKAQKMSTKVIADCVVADNKINDSVRAKRCVGQALKRMVTAGTIVRCTGIGASGSFKMLPKSAEPKPKPKKPAKKPAAKKAKKTPKSPAKKAKSKTTTKKTTTKKPAAKKATTPKKAAAKKPAAKKPAAKKPAAKKPAAKKPAAKKPAARKPAAKKGAK